ncbi:Regulator of G-protein signaling 14 [Bagarius yarrelli]|uniref:Regulator of G-protein signaling 14 n=1 Tax=Bagarius yarrelli TaxID=175774 RepID=A0A556TXD9_BAGYA|nr:Regulator of G-protein signaling 14 [Bagarius yarrelli]
MLVLPSNLGVLTATLNGMANWFNAPHMDQCTFDYWETGVRLSTQELRSGVYTVIGGSCELRNSPYLSPGLEHNTVHLQRYGHISFLPPQTAFYSTFQRQELNALEPVKRTNTQCSNSNSSLPSVQSGGASGVGQVASWAVSFERLLEDPLGVLYFTEFLKSELSVENILFWLACENFRKIPANNKEKLSREALSIYNSYLSKCACNPINIDDKVRVNEKDIQQPHPEIFQKAQQQGRSLPELSPCQKIPLTARQNSPVPKEQQKSELKSKEKLKVKLSRNAGETDEVVERRKTILQGKINWEKRKDKRGSWGEGLVARSTNSADKYCCVFLPDGTASLTPARPGITIRHMLTGLCEKRGLPLSDIIIFLQGKDKQPLSLDQDSSVLKDQQVHLELRVTFLLEIVFTDKSVAIVAKSNKTLQEALSSLLQKHHLRPQDVFVTMVRRGAVDVDLSVAGFYRSNPKQKNPALRRAYDMEGLVELLNRAQCCSADDQRGLLRKEDLILPNFLQLEEQEEEVEQRSADPPAVKSREKLELEEPASNTKVDATKFPTSALCSTEPVDRTLTKEHSNPARETVRREETKREEKRRDRRREEKRREEKRREENRREREERREEKRREEKRREERRGEDNKKRKEKRKDETRRVKEKKGREEKRQKRRKEKRREGKVEVSSADRAVSVLGGVFLCAVLPPFTHQEQQDRLHQHPPSQQGGHRGARRFIRRAKITAPPGKRMG